MRKAVDLVDGFFVFVFVFVVADDNVTTRYIVARKM